MRFLILILVTGILPFVWGWLVHWLIARLWPLSDPAIGSGAKTPITSFTHDYQI